MNEITPYNGQMVPARDAMYMPVVSVQKAMERRDMLNAFTATVMVDERDYGVIPGTGDKKVLLKPGAEKLASFFGLVPDFVIEERVLDFDGTEHNGEPLLYYRVRCDLYRMGVKVGSGVASCSSRESKYRYRKAERVCPKCGRATIFKSKKDGEGWFCWAAKGGCGENFKKGDKSIEEQDTRRIPNPDIADVENTVLKQAEKRALVAGVLICTNVSDHFTQDLEDFAEYRVVAEQGNGAPPDEQDFYDAPPPNGKAKGKQEQKKQEPPAPAKVSDDTLKALHAAGRELYGDMWDEKRHAMVEAVTAGKHTSSKDLSQKQAEQLLNGINERMAALRSAAAEDEAGRERSELEDAEESGHFMEYGAK